MNENFAIAHSWKTKRGLVGIGTHHLDMLVDDVIMNSKTKCSVGLL